MTVKVTYIEAFAKVKRRKDPFAICDNQSFQWEPDFPGRSIYTLGMVLNFCVLTVA